MTHSAAERWDLVAREVCSRHRQRPSPAACSDAGSWFRRPSLLPSRAAVMGRWDPARGCPPAPCPPLPIHGARLPDTEKESLPVERAGTLAHCVVEEGQTAPCKTLGLLSCRSKKSGTISRVHLAKHLLHGFTQTLKQQHQQHVRTGEKMLICNPSLPVQPSQKVKGTALCSGS